MKFIRCFMADIKRMIINPYFAAGVLALIVMCFTSSVYLDPIEKREYNVIETFLKFRSEDTYHVSAQHVSRSILLNWFEMFIPIIAGFPFVNVICDELQSGAKRYYIHRTGMLRYSLSKILSSLISAALLCLTAYLIFTGLVYIMFPSIDSMSKDQAENFSMFGLSYTYTLTNIVLQGVGASLITLFLTAFVHNKYFCLCIPFFINYLRMMIHGKMLFDAFARDDFSYQTAANLISPDSINNITFENEGRVPAIIMYSIILVTVTAVFYFAQKGRTDNGA